MPKLKNKKGVVKRFRFSKKGKIKYATCGRGHLLSSKTTKRKRQLRKKNLIDTRQVAKYLKREVPYM